jgi:two-component system, NarL family, nitrate/nitrite response regulator NarL
MAVVPRTEALICGVLVADPLPLFRDALARVVRNSPVLRVAAETETLADTTAALRRLEPELAMVGGDGDDLDPLAVLRHVAMDRLATRVIAVLERADRETAYQAVAAGAAGCVTRLAGPAEVTDALALAARGGIHVARELQAPIAAEIRFRERARRSLLSDRETEVLRAVASGHSAAVIARDLHVGVTTVKTHMTRAYQKLGVSDRAAAVAVAMRRGLLE